MWGPGHDLDQACAPQPKRGTATVSTYLRSRRASNWPVVRCRLRPRHPLHDELVYSFGARRRLERHNQYDAAGALACARRRNDAMTPVAATVSTCLHMAHYVRI